MATFESNSSPSATTTLGIHISGHPPYPSYSLSPTSTDDDSPRITPSPELVHDDLSPPTTAEPTTPHASWPSSDVDQSSSGLSKGEQITQLPTLYQEFPTMYEAGHIMDPTLDGGGSIQIGGAQNSDNIGMASEYANNSSLFPGTSKSNPESGSTTVGASPQYSPTRTPSPFVPPLPSVSSESVSSGPFFPDNNPTFITPPTEASPSLSPPAVVSTGFPVSGGQRVYWTVDPFQNPMTDEHAQEPAIAHLSSLLEPVHGPLKPILVFCLDTLPRQIYLHLLLRLPRLYFSRLTRIFHDAELSLPEMQKLALVTWAQLHGVGDYIPASMRSELNPAHSEAFANLKFNWEAFIESLMTEWKMNNIVAVLLLSAILTTLQIDGVSNDPIARNAALTSLICGLMGLLYGCMYTVRFGTMRQGYKAIQWAEEAQQTKTRIFWNVWVFLAMPAVWLCWSIILFITSIMAYVWRTGSDHDPFLKISPTQALGPRLAVTGLFALGMLYFGLIIFTLRRYGDIIDEKWKKRVASWVKENIPREAYAPGTRSRNSQTVSMMAPGFAQMPFPATPPMSTDYTGYTTMPISPWMMNGWGSPFPNSGTSGLSPNHSPWYIGNQPPPTPWGSNNPNSWGLPPTNAQPPRLTPRQSKWGSSPGNPGYPNFTPPAHADPQLPLAPGSLPFTPIRLPIEPDPLTLIPSLPMAGTPGVVAVEVPPVYVNQSQLPRSGPTSGARYPQDLENIYKAILPVFFTESNPFGVEATPLSQISKPLTPFATVRVMTLNTTADNEKSVPEGLDRDITRRDWETFITNMELAWRNQHPAKQIKPQLNSEYFPISQHPRRHDFIACLLHWWNDIYFSKRRISVFLCEEFSSDSPWKTNFAIYLTAHATQWTREKMREKFKNISTAGLQMINIYPPFDPATPRLILVAESVLLDRPQASIQGPISPFRAIKMTNLGRLTHEAVFPPEKLGGWDVDVNAWNRFTTVMQNNWINEDTTDPSVPRPLNFIPCFVPFCEQLLDAWNNDYFRPLNMEAFLCSESSWTSDTYAIYLTHASTFPRVTRFDGSPGVTELHFYSPNVYGPPEWIPIDNSNLNITPPRVHFEDGAAL